MAVEDEEPAVSLLGFLLRVAIKHLFELRYTDVVVALARRSTADANALV
jgi:hypothetical protein